MTTITAGTSRDGRLTGLDSVASHFRIFISQNLQCTETLVVRYIDSNVDCHLFPDRPSLSLFSIVVHDNIAFLAIPSTAHDPDIFIDLFIGVADILAALRAFLEFSQFYLL